MITLIYGFCKRNKSLKEIVNPNIIGGKNLLYIINEVEFFSLLNSVEKH